MTAIEAVAADYIEGWYPGDEARMDRALHHDLVKRITVPGDERGDVSFRVVTKQRMVEMTADGGGDDPDSTFAVTVDDIWGDIASARTVSKGYVECLQPVETPAGRKIAHVLFRMR